MIKQKIAAFFAGILMATIASADNLQLREDHPDTYTVKNGDTLWDISGVFLKKPWYWPKIWQVNPQVKDPHWIYPGDVLNLVYINGEPRLVSGVKKLSPSVRRNSSDDAIKSIDIDSLKPFLTADYIFPSNGDFANLPYVLGDNFNVANMADVSVIYVQGVLNEGEQYGMYSSPKKYKDRNTGELLGYRASLSGVGVAGKPVGDKTPLTLVKTVKEVRQGDRVLPLSDVSGYDAFYVPSPVSNVNNAYVIENVSDSIYAGKYNVVVINKGSRDSIKNGDVFAISRKGVAVSGSSADNIQYTQFGTVTQRLSAAVSKSSNLPSVEIGHVMVFKTYEKLSLGLVLDSTDFVVNGVDLISPEE